jgi:hypothetical protein
MKPYEDEAGNFPLREHALVEDHLFQIYVPRRRMPGLLCDVVRYWRPAGMSETAKNLDGVGRYERKDNP